MIDEIDLGDRCAGSLHGGGGVEEKFLVSGVAVVCCRSRKGSFSALLDSVRSEVRFGRGSVHLTGFGEVWLRFWVLVPV